jgi:two-component system LytT family response regulator
MPDDTLRALLVDDEPLARTQLRRLLAGSGVEVAAECADGEAALRNMQSDTFDLVFLDIQMPRLDGLTVARRMAALGKAQMPHAVFVTAYDQHAIEALRADAVDYLLKPIEPVALENALARVRSRMSARRAPLRRLAVPTDGGFLLLDLATVGHFAADGNYVTAYAAGRGHMIRRTLTALEQQLDPAQFSRVHRSTIVNLASVREIRPWFRGEYLAVMESGAKVRIGATYRDAFFRAVESPPRRK